MRLQATNVSRAYGAVQALDQVDFELKPGEVMALLGENGAGKSTFVKVLSGLVSPDEGTITMDGETVDLSTTAKSQAAGVAVVQQEYSLIPSMSIAENLMLGGNDAKTVWSRSALRKPARELLDRVGLTDIDPSRKVEELSVAEMQLVEIARVLKRDAKVVIFDEPTAALSDSEIDRVLNVVTDLAKSGHGIIYVTHRLPEVFRISDRVTVFREGKSMEPRETKDLNVDGIISLMLGRTLTSMYPPRPDKLGEVLFKADEVWTSQLTEPVSLEVRAGEILGLTGQLGSGADSIIEAIAATRPCAIGDVELDSEHIDVATRKHGLDNGVAFCSADRKADGIFAQLSILSNLSAPWLDRVTNGGVIARGREREIASGIASTFAIDAGRFANPVSTLSGGNQQKVALGRWLGVNPKVLLVLEPTRGVDVGARADIYLRLRELCSEGMAIIVASSDTSEILGLCDTIATFAKGRLTAMAPHDEWTEDSLTKEVMTSGLDLDA